MNPSNGYGLLLTPLLFLFIHPPHNSTYGSMAARKRLAQEGVQGAPVNKRKSLLMRPRHYSPSEACCEEENEDLAPPQDKEELRNIDTPAGRQMSCCLSVLMNNWRWILKSHLLHSYFRPSQLPFRARHQPDPIVIMYWKWKTTLLGLHKLCLSHILRLKFICHDFFFFGMAFPHFFDEARFRTSHFLFFLMCLVFREKPFKNRLKRLRIETLWSCLLEDLLFWISSVAVCEVSWVECRIYTSLIDY